MFSRYAVYFTPSGPLADVGAAWLGWDVATGMAVAHPQVVDLNPAELTETPRKYGFHATLKPPMVLRDGMTADMLQARLEEFCKSNAAVVLEGHEVKLMGRFFALTPKGDVTKLKALAGSIVREFDDFRAAPSEQELERRRAAGLSPAQEENLVKWGYPYVLDQFRFHMTLSGRVDNGEPLASAVSAHFEPFLPKPFELDHLTMAGQRSDGMFQEIVRLPLTG